MLQFYKRTAGFLVTINKSVGFLSQKSIHRKKNTASVYVATIFHCIDMNISNIFVNTDFMMKTTLIYYERKWECK